MTEQRNADVIREALKDALGVNWKIRCEAGARGAATGALPPTTSDAADEPDAAHDEEEESMLAEAGNVDLRRRRAAIRRRPRWNCCRASSAPVASRAASRLLRSGLVRAAGRWKFR